MAYDNLSNSNQTETRQFTAISTPGAIGPSFSEQPSPLVTPGVCRIDVPLQVVNVEQNGTFTVQIMYLDAMGNPVNATSATAEITDANGTVVQQAEVQEFANGTYGVQSDVSGLSRGDYNMTIQLDGNDCSGITVRVTAYAPALGILYDDGQFSPGRAMVAGGVGIVSVFLLILSIGVLFP
jgi:hypothetical protein